jgi:hypothetical protein
VAGASDRGRYLSRQLGYVNTSAIAMDGLECIGPEEQRRQTDDAHRRWKHEQARVWGQAKTEILSGIAGFQANGHPDRRTESDLRAMVRLTSRIDARIRP